MRIILVSLVFALGCSSKPDPETFAANWLRDLAEGRADQAYEQLCADAQERLSSLGLHSSGEAPKVFLKRLAGRYGGIDRMTVVESTPDFVDLEIETSRARLPLRLLRQAQGFCVTLAMP